eukprot:1031036-Prymnesium_polylepis.2
MQDLDVPLEPHVPHGGCDDEPLSEPVCPTSLESGGIAAGASPSVDTDPDPVRVRRRLRAWRALGPRSRRRGRGGSDASATRPLMLPSCGLRTRADGRGPDQTTLDGGAVSRRRDTPSPTPSVGAARISRDLGVISTTGHKGAHATKVPATGTAHTSPIRIPRSARADSFDWRLCAD